MEDEISEDWYHVITEEEHRRDNWWYKQVGGATQRNIVLEFLVENEGVVVTYEHVCDATSLTVEDVKIVFEELIRDGIVLYMRDNLYMLNLKNPEARRLRDLYIDNILRNFVMAKIEYEKGHLR